MKDNIDLSNDLIDLAMSIRDRLNICAENVCKLRKVLLLDKDYAFVLNIIEHDVMKIELVINQHKNKL